MRYKIPLLVLAIIFFIAVFNIAMPEKAAAQDEYWSVSAANWMQYWFFDEERSEYQPARMDSLDNRLIVDFNLGDFYAGMWLDNLQIDRPDDSFEKMSQRYFGWRDRGFTLHAGNFYQVFDRGLTLNAFLDDAVDYDNNLDGIKVSGIFDKFDFDAFSARGGYDAFLDDRQYILRGVRGAVSPILPIRIGMSYIRFKENDLFTFGQSKNANITGVNAGVSYGPFDLYAEYATKRGKKDTLTNIEVNGDGTYLSGSAAFEKISFYSEYKNIINLLYPGPQNPFNSPPPLSHQGRSLSSLAGVKGERGYQIGALLSPTYDINLDIAYSESFSRDNPTDLYLSERYAGLRVQATDNLVFNYNWDFIKYTAEDETENYFDTYYYLGDVSTLSLTAYTKRFKFFTGEGHHEDYLILGYGLANKFQLSLGGSLSKNHLSQDPEKLAYAELIIRFDNHELVIFQGGERGGLICSSGICQIRPTFQGTRVILFSRF